jgi:hypothetical protein
MKTALWMSPSLCLGMLMFAGAASAHEDGCSIEKLAGRWAFATDVGHETITFGGDITALGVFRLARNGAVSGEFDVTFESNLFVPGVTFEGTMTVDRDCRGSLTFVTATGATRTDSIFVLNRYQIWGMSQDPQNLWTYRAARVVGR